MVLASPVAEDALTEQSTLLAALLMPPRLRRRAGEAAAAGDTMPFFRIQGRIGPRTVTAELASGCLRADDALRDAAEVVARCTAVDDDRSLRASLRRRVGAMRALLACFDEITHAEVGVDVEGRPSGSALPEPGGVLERGGRERTLLPDRPPPQGGTVYPVPVGPARAERCPVCASRATTFEYHAPHWCPSGSPTAHIHRCCNTCGHIWYEAP